MGLKVGTVTSSLSRNAGGLFHSVRSLSATLSALPRVEVKTHGIEDSYAAEDVNVWSPLQLGLHPRRGPFAKSLAQAPGLYPALLEGNYDLLHTHGIWQWPSIAVSQWHTTTGRPYLISPRGMLDPWAVSQSVWKKKLAGFLFEHRHLRNAHSLHALCASEADSMRAFGLKNPICVIPNGINLPEESNGQGFYAMDSAGEPPPGGIKAKCGKKILLFLGRLHRKKGLVNALRAWSTHAKSEDWQFVIAGWDQGRHEVELKQLCDDLFVTYAQTPAAEFTDSQQLTTDNSASVIFVGPAFGDTKNALLRQASAFILPSFSEGLPMSVLEAWSYRLPVLMTEHCNIPEGFAAEAAIRINTDIESITEGLRSLLSAPSSSLTTMGAAGRTLVEQQFTWPSITTQMKQVYDWALGGGDKPESVIS